MKTILIIGSFICCSLLNTTISNKPTTTKEKTLTLTVVQQKYSLSQLIGVYEIKEQGYSFSITLKKDKLYAEQSWNKVSFVINRNDDNTFKGDGKKFIFSDLKDDKVQSLTVIGDRKATFTRK